MSNILLLYPQTPADTYWSFSHSLGMIEKKAATPPLGLLTIAGMLPVDVFSLRLVDMNVRDLADADIEWADVVFVSAMIAQKDSFAETLARVKTFGKTTVAGGPYSSSAYRELENIDCFVMGEAEGVWTSFLADLRGGSLKSAYAAPVRESEANALRDFFGPMAHIVSAESYPDINAAPLPRFDLIELNQYASMTIQASRGCPVGCEFCDIWRRYGRKTRIKTPERILAEMDVLYARGWRDSVFLVDDNFIGNRVRAREILSHLVAWQRQRRHPFTFLTEATLSLGDDPAMLDLMADAGFTSIFVGIETPSEDSLRETGKHINLTGSMLEKAIRIQEKGIQLMSGFIIGFDADPDDIAERMTACIQDLGIPQAMVGLLNALPDTDLYDRLEAENRISHQTSGNNTHAFTTNFRTIRPEADVVRDYKQVLKQAYPGDMKAYFARCAALRGRWPKKSDHRQNLPFGWKAKVFGRYLLKVMASPYRFTALGFLLRTLLVRPSFLEQAIELGIKGHHHWAITWQAFEVEDMRTSLSSHLHSLSASVRCRLEAIESSFGSLMPKGLHVGEDALGRVMAFLGTLRDIRRPSDEKAEMRRKIEEALAEIARQGQQAQQQVEKQYQRLSRAARKKLVGDMELFFREVDRRSGLPAVAR